MPVSPSTEYCNHVGLQPHYRKLGLSPDRTEQAQAELEDPKLSESNIKIQSRKSGLALAQAGFWV